MVVLQWKCRHSELCGHIAHPMPRWIAERIMKKLAALHEDYEYWLEELVAAEAK